MKVCPFTGREYVVQIKTREKDMAPISEPRVRKFKSKVGPKKGDKYVVFKYFKKVGPANGLALDSEGNFTEYAKKCALFNS